MKDVIINGKKYRLIANYKHNDKLRGRLNSLIQKVYSFDFEKWYKSGYWTDNCILYSLLDNDKVISHITVSVIDFIVMNEKKKFVQLGTVMTDKEYRKQGLSNLLMEEVLNEWKNKCDMIYLFANDSVLDFYPKFGFVPVNEYQAVKKVSEIKSAYEVRKMDIDEDSDCNLLYETAKKTVPLSKISMQDNAGLVMFYCNCLDVFSLKENLFYIKDLNAIAVAEYEEDTLILYDILATNKIEIDDVINSLLSEKIQNVVLRFMPINSENYEVSIFKEEDSTLFVMDDKSKLFKENKLIFPLLSHT